MTAANILKKMYSMDNPWQMMIEQFFPEFMCFFFPEIERDIAWEKDYEFLDQELQQIIKTAETEARFTDKLIKIALKNGTNHWISIHIEIQGPQQKPAFFEKRIYVYNHQISDQYHVNVASLAILTDENPNYYPHQYQVRQWGCKTTFDFPCVKLMHYADTWQQLEQDNNVFAMVVMAHLKAIEIKEDDLRQMWKLTLTKALYQQDWKPTTIIALFQFINWAIQLPEDLQQSFWRDVIAFEKEISVQYITTGKE